jgi:tungstate transport system ATP-binding protein
MNVNISGLVKRIGDKTILNISDLSIKKGYIYGIVGPNGSGKTTLLRIIAGLDDDYEGIVTYGDDANSPQSFSRVKEFVSMFHQKPYIFDMSVRQNIELGVKLSGKKNMDVVAELIQMMGLIKMEDKNALKLSGGEAQKTALGRVLAVDPGLLLLDEPTANIDPENTRIIENTVNSVKAKHDKTVVIVTHNVFQAARLCDYVIYMESGRIVETVAREDIMKSRKIKELMEYTSGM